MAKIYKTNGTIEDLTIPKDANQQLRVLQKAVGGYVERIYTDPATRQVLLGNEEGLFVGCQPNRAATQLLRQLSGRNDTVVLVGDIVVASLDEIR